METEALKAEQEARALEILFESVNASTQEHLNGEMNDKLAESCDFYHGLITCVSAKNLLR